MTISSSSKEPRLIRMPFAAHGSELGWSNFFRYMSILKYFNGSDQSVLKEVVVDHSIEDVETAVIRGTGQERPSALVETHISNSFVMVLHVFVRLTSHIHIEPYHLLVVSSEHKIISFGVDGDRRDPLRARLVFGYDRLFLQIILEHSSDCACKEVGFCRMESHTSNDTFSLRERFLSSSASNRVDKDLTGHLNIVSHGRKVVTLGVPD